MRGSLVNDLTSKINAGLNSRGFYVQTTLVESIVNKCMVRSIIMYFSHFSKLFKTTRVGCHFSALVAG